MEEYPETKALFTRVHGDDVKSPEFAAHAYRVFNALGLVRGSLNNHQVLEQITSHLARQHENRPGVKREHFAVSTNWTNLLYLTVLLF